MKKNAKLILLILFNVSLWAQTKDYQLNLNSINLKTSSKLENLTQQCNFPKDYEETLRTTIYNYEHTKELIKKQFIKDATTKQQKWDSLSYDFNTWRNHQKNTFRSAEKKWTKVQKKYNLENSYKNDFIGYHFYISIKNSTNQSIIKQYASSPSFKDYISTVANQEATAMVNSSSKLQKLSKTAIDYGTDTLKKHLQQLIESNLSTNKPLVLEKNNEAYRKIALEAAKEKESEFKENLKKQKKKEFITHANELNIDTSTANKVLKLINTRNSDLQTLKERKKQEKESMSDLFESTDLKTKSEIKKEFASKLSKLLSKREFATLFGNLFEKNVTNKTEEKISEIKEAYKIKEEQLNKVTEMVNSFYFNKEITAAYYSFDKKLKKQKLSALKYKFSEQYKTLMEDLNLKVKSSKKIDNNTYQW